MNLDGARILVTGASGGIGHAIVRALSARGAELVLTGRRTTVLEPLAAEVGGRAIPADLVDRSSIEALLDKAGDIDAVVANAGLPASGQLTSFGLADIDETLDVNLRAAVIIARLVIPQLVTRGRGHLVFISSISGKMASAGTSVYNATKFGMRGFSLALREELRASGVGVSAIFPGFVRDAGMFADAKVELPKLVGTSSPEEVARAVIRAIERNIGEVDVAPPLVRLSCRLAILAPALSMAVQRRFGAERITGDLATRRAEER